MHLIHAHGRKKQYESNGNGTKVMSHSGNEVFLPQTPPPRASSWEDSAAGFLEMSHISEGCAAVCVTVLPVGFSLCLHLHIFLSSQALGGFMVNSCNGYGYKYLLTAHLHSLPSVTVVCGYFFVTLYIEVTCLCLSSPAHKL